MFGSWNFAGRVSVDEIIYAGREEPAKSAEYTFKIMKMRFGF
jgi:hypothetical protein